VGLPAAGVARPKVIGHAGRCFTRVAQGAELRRAASPPAEKRAALRWFRRYLDECKAVSLPRAQVALSELAELRADDRTQQDC